MGVLGRIREKERKYKARKALLLAKFKRPKQVEKQPSSLSYLGLNIQSYVHSNDNDSWRQIRSLWKLSESNTLTTPKRTIKPLGSDTHKTVKESKTVATQTEEIPIPAKTTKANKKKNSAPQDWASQQKAHQRERDLKHAQYLAAEKGKWGTNRISRPDPDDEIYHIDFAPVRTNGLQWPSTEVILVTQK